MIWPISTGPADALVVARTTPFDPICNPVASVGTVIFAFSS
jgi:hypothetical protein